MYAGRVFLAPMVRIGTLPTRLLALEYGADLVYGEELIDHKMVQCARRENRALGTVDFVAPDGDVIFRTCAAERDHVIFQMGGGELSGQTRQGDVAGIDVNMGCPKSFSLQGGMGAALLSQPAKATEILTSLVRASRVPVTCKIRLLDTVDATVAFAKAVEATGVAAVAVHARHIAERPRDAPHYEYVRAVSAALRIPVIANGGSNEIKEHADLDRVRRLCDASSIMVARAAQWDPSIFRKEGKLPLDDVVRSYLRYTDSDGSPGPQSVLYDNPYENSKYVVMQIMHELLGTPRGQQLLQISSMRQLCDLWDMGSVLEAALAARVPAAPLAATDGDDAAPVGATKHASDAADDIDGAHKRSRNEHHLDVHVRSRALAAGNPPKMALYNYCAKHGRPLPLYETDENPLTRLFRTTVVLGDQRFTTTNWHKSKKFAEHSAAVVAVALARLPVPLDPDLLDQPLPMLEPAATDDRPPEGAVTAASG